MSGSRVRRIMAEGIDSAGLTKAQAGEIARHVQKIRVDDGPTHFTRKKRRAAK